MSTDDARQMVAEYTAMGTAGTASQATIIRRETVRLREAVLTGTLASAATTRVFLVGVKDPVMLDFGAIVLSATVDNWQQGVWPATVNYTISWDGPAAATPANKNSFVFQSVVAALQGQASRIWCKYVERL